MSLVKHVGGVSILQVTNLIQSSIASAASSTPVAISSVVALLENEVGISGGQAATRPTDYLLTRDLGGAA